MWEKCVVSQFQRLEAQDQGVDGVPSECYERGSIPPFSLASGVFLVISGLYKRLYKPSLCKSLPGGSDGKESTRNAGDPGSIISWIITAWSGRSPLEGNGYPLQYACLENSMDRGAWRATAHGVAPFQSPPSSLHGVCPVCLSVSKFPLL